MNNSEFSETLRGLVWFRDSKLRFLLAAGTAVCALAISLAGQWILGSTAELLCAFAVILATGLSGLLAGLLASFCSVAMLVCLSRSWPTLGIDLTGGLIADNWWQYASTLGVLVLSTHAIVRHVTSKLQIRPLGVFGNLDGIQDGEIYGWAFDADRPSEPVLVTLFMNHRPVAHAAAVHYRPDVASIMNCSGRHGFYLDLEECASTIGSSIDYGEALIDVRLADGTSLGNSPSVLKLRNIVPATPRPTILFMHIPKTAGTAFREAIAGSFRQSEIAYIYPTPPGFLVSDLRALPLLQRKAFRVVIGHFQFGMHEALPQKSEYITIVREPVARVLSQYRYLQETQPHLVVDARGRPLSLESVLESRGSVDFDNVLVRCFSGVDEREFPPGQLTRDIFDMAVRNLRTAFTFVGHQESSAKAFGWLKRHYGWQKAEQLEVVNSGRLKTDDESSERAMAAIRHFNQWDLLFYEEILKAFPR